jgi:hypothetical protein
MLASAQRRGNAFPGHKSVARSSAYCRARRAPMVSGTCHSPEGPKECKTTRECVRDRPSLTGLSGTRSAWVTPEICRFSISLASSPDLSS